MKPRWFIALDVHPLFLRGHNRCVCCLNSNTFSGTMIHSSSACVCTGNPHMVAPTQLPSTTPTLLQPCTSFAASSLPAQRHGAWFLASGPALRPVYNRQVAALAYAATLMLDSTSLCFLKLLLPCHSGHSTKISQSEPASTTAGGAAAPSAVRLSAPQLLGQRSEPQ